jgi:predicted metal-dependent HD superfamily phosphohydrolase
MAIPDRRALLSRWEALGTSLSRQGPAWTAEGRRLLRHWSFWPRAYHDTHHLRACLDHWEDARSGAGDGGPEAMDDPQAVALALWFHDAVYWPWSGRNEERSARWARRFLQGQGLPAATAGTVERHILATRHGHAAAAAGDDRWVLDIDLAILGQPPAVYAAFERNVRREYRFVHWPRYRAGRCAILRSFLERPALYETEWFRSRYEAQARVNLAQALDVLGRGGAF